MSDREINKIVSDILDHQDDRSVSKSDAIGLMIDVRDKYEPHLAALTRELEEAIHLLTEAQHEIYLASKGNPELVATIKDFLSRNQKGAEG